MTTITYTPKLVTTAKGVGLTDAEDTTLNDVFYIDLLSKQMQYRQQHATLRNELIARAVGLKPKDQPTIVDLTAGLGRDSFILATLGFTVTMLERSPIVYALLKDALDRARQDPANIPIVDRLTLIQADALTWLPTQPAPDILYLDPMFPTRQKSAKVKKGIQLLQSLLGVDNDAEALCQLALSCSTRRVVIKRPLSAPHMGGKAPNFALKGKNSRFDIYL